MAEPQTRGTFLGTVTADEGEALAFDIPADLDPDKIAAALEQTERERIEKRAAESAELRKLFPVEDKPRG
jgi:hypothetical protein